MKTLTVNRKELRVNTGSWHWKWYTWSLWVIYDFFDGHTTYPRDAKYQKTNLCAYVQTRTAAIAILLLQVVALGGLLVSLTWLPVHLFGIWEYLNVWRVLAIAVLVIIGLFALRIAILPDRSNPYRESAEYRMYAALVAIGSVALARLLIWNTGDTEYFNHIAGTMVLLGSVTAIIFGVTLRLQKTATMQSVEAPVEAPGEMPVVEQRVTQEETIGFWRVVWLYMKAVKAKVCPTVEPTPPTASTEEVSA